jgi:hypothetical protein
MCVCVGGGGLHDMCFENFVCVRGEGGLQEVYFEVRVSV